MSRHAYLVDHDRDVRRTTILSLRNAGFECRAFASGWDLIETAAELVPGVVLLELQMPDRDALVIMAQLEQDGVDWPVIVMSADANVMTAVQAMKLGAADFLQKPFDQDVLLAAVELGLEGMLARRGRAKSALQAQRRLEMLRPRELQVLQGLLDGFQTREIAQRLDLSTRTVEMHRANMMDRLGTQTLAAALALAMSGGMSANGGLR